MAPVNAQPRLGEPKWPERWEQGITTYPHNLLQVEGSSDSRIMRALLATIAQTADLGVSPKMAPTARNEHTSAIRMSFLIGSSPRHLPVSPVWPNAKRIGVRFTQGCGVLLMSTSGVECPATLQRDTPLHLAGVRLPVPLERH